MLLFFGMMRASANARKQIEIDDQIIGLIGEGNMEAFERLYRDTEPAVHAFLLSLVKNPEDAADLTQDTYLKLRSAAHLYEPMGKPLAWMFTIARNLAMNHFRSQGKVHREGFESMENLSDFSKVEDPTNRLVLESAFSVLEDEKRQTVLLHVVGGMKHREIAEILGVPLSTALSNYHRSLRKLRQYLTEEGVSL